MNFRHIATWASVTSLAALTACAPGLRAERRDEMRQERVAVAPAPAPVYAQTQYAEFGEVRDIQVIPVASRTSGGGAVVGAVLGAVVGNQFGKGGGRVAATGLGAVGGAVAGNAVEARGNRGADEVYRVSVRFDNGAVRNYDFQRVDDLRVGDRVKWEEGQLHRL